METKTNECNHKSDVIKINLTDEQKRRFCLEFKKGIYEELHKQHLLSDSQLNILLNKCH